MRSPKGSLELEGHGLAGRGRGGAYARVGGLEKKLVSETTDLRGWGPGFGMDTEPRIFFIFLAGE